MKKVDGFVKFQSEGEIEDDDTENVAGGFDFQAPAMQQGLP